jgi:hypothetical protein
MGSRVLLAVIIYIDQRFGVKAVLSQVCKQQTLWAAKMRIRVAKLDYGCGWAADCPACGKVHPIRWTRIQELSSSLPSFCSSLSATISLHIPPLLTRP